MVDAQDYRLLKALVHVGTITRGPAGEAAGLDEAQLEEAVAAAGGGGQTGWDLVIGAYLRGDISLGRSAALLGLSRFDLALRLNRLDAPSPQGLRPDDDLRQDMAALER